MAKWLFEDWNVFRVGAGLQNEVGRAHELLKYSVPNGSTLHSRETGVDPSVRTDGGVQVVSNYQKWN